MSRTQTLTVVAAGLVTVTIAAVAVFASRGDDDPDGKQALVAERGRGVMPFDLERTTHRFEKRASGGVQTVVADDPADREQVGLIRTHLAKEARLFRQGVSPTASPAHEP